MPEHRDRPNPRTIRLAVAIVHSPDPAPRPDPVVVLTGGPGGHALEMVPDMGTPPARDLVVFDRRGVGHSQPALDCADRDPPVDLACRDGLLARGVDLTAYTTRENAADVADLWPALGYRTVNLLGISYGSRLALTVMREHPQGVRSVTLSSPLPAQAGLLAAMPARADRAFTALFGGCAADGRCRAAYPDLERVLYAAADRLDASPQRLRGWVDTRSFDVELDGRALVSLLYDGIYRGDMAGLPRGIYAVWQHRDLELWRRQVEQDLRDRRQVSFGMQASVLCTDEAPFAARDRVVAVDARYPRQRHALSGLPLLDLCRDWPTGPADPAARAPVRSTIPTLILTGGYDPPTPPSFGRLAAATLPHSVLVTVPALSHLPMSACVQAIRLAFWDDPGRTPDTGCVATEQHPAWVADH